MFAKVLVLPVALKAIFDIINGFADGCRPDVNSLRVLLDEVAQCNRETFTLHRHICATEVRSDWPLYTDEDRAVLSRFLRRLL